MQRKLMSSLLAMARTGLSAIIQKPPKNDVTTLWENVFLETDPSSRVSRILDGFGLNADRTPAGVLIGPKTPRENNPGFRDVIPHFDVIAPRIGFDEAIALERWSRKYPPLYRGVADISRWQAMLQNLPYSPLAIMHAIEGTFHPGGA